MPILSKEKIYTEPVTRQLTIDRAQFDADALTVPASLSSETPADQYFGKEILVHSKAAINLERAGDNGLPLLLNHNREQLIGRVKNIKLKDKKLQGILHFSPNSEAGREAWADVEAGFLTDISISYRIEEVKETIHNDENVVKVTRWKPSEASVVSVPADATIGINRNETNEAGIMTETTEQTTTPAAAPVSPAPELTLTTFNAGQAATRAAGIAEGATAERARVSEITRIFSLHADRADVITLRDQFIEKGIAPDAANRLLLEHLATGAEPAAATRTQTEGNHGVIPDGGDEAEKWVEGISQTLEVRGGLITDREARRAAQKTEFFGMSLGDMARDYLNRQRVNLSGMSRQEIAGQAFTRAGMHGTSDFSNVLENVANKSMLIGYDEAPETWAAWCRIGSLSDFKAASRVNISSFSDLELILESAEYKEGHVSDLKETIQLVKYGKLFSISREAIINDDVDAFTRIPLSMGRAAARTVGDMAYNILTSNPTLNQDATTLFHANHSNLGTGSVIDEAALNEFMVLMAAQTSPAPGTGETGAVLNISPRFLLVPKALVMTATKQVRTVTAPDTTGDLTVNTQLNAWEIISDYRLDADSAAQYYGAADPNQADTVEVAFLDGNDQPFMDSQNGFTQDGVQYKVRIEAAAAASDFRGLVRNAGP